MFRYRPILRYLPGLLLLPGLARSQSATLTLNPSSAPPGGTAAMSLNIAATGAMLPAAIQWSFTYSATDVAGIQVALSAGATASGKSVTCFTGSASTSCVVFGVNSSTLTNGLLATVSISLTSSVTNPSVPIQIASVLATSSTGTAIPGSGSGAAITVQAVLAPAGVTCNPPSVMGPGTSSCTVTLNGVAPAGGFTVNLASNNPAVTVPPSVQVPATLNAAGFSATVAAVAADQTASISGTAAGITKSFLLTAAGPPQLTSLVCSPGSLASSQSTTCTLLLSKAAPSSLSVSLTSDSVLLPVPAPTLTVPAQAQSVQFTATAGAIATTQTATLSATLNSVTVSSAVTLSPPVFTALRVRTGSLLAYLDPSGNVWNPDNGFNVNSSVFATGSNIGGTNAPALYQAERWSSGSLQYQFSVPAGNYSVRLKFAEIYFAKPASRVFHIQLNGTTVLQNFDVLAEAGGANLAVDKIFPVNASTGSITVTLVPVTSNPKISAIEILPLATGITVSPTRVLMGPSGTQLFKASVSGSSNTGVTWTLSPNVGSIAADGTYTAPATPAAGTQVTVTATSAADPTKSASAIVSLTNGWGQRDVSSGSATTTAVTPSNGAFSITGSGDIYGASDQFRFVYLTWPGDGAITARLNPQATCCLNPTKAGLMFRDSVSAGATHVFMGLYSDIAAMLEVRTTAGQSTSVLFDGTGAYWLKLVRQGNTFRGYLSAEGTNWHAVGSAVTIATAPASMLAGFAVSSGGPAAYTALFDNISLSGPVSVSIDQTLISLAAGQQAALSASVIGTANSTVTWTSSPPGTGSIDPNTGVYTAPAQLPSQTSVNLTATSVSSPASSATVTATLGSFVPIRVNAGGPAHIDPTGVFWSADTGSSAGSYYSSGASIAATLTPYLYQSERFHTAAFQYAFYVPNGTYNVKLKFAEIYFTAAGKRLFNVAINGLPVLVNFDIVASAGAPNTAYDRTFPTNVTNGQIVIAFTPVLSAPKINAIEITP